MFQIQKFMKELDQIYQSGQMKQAETYLLNGIEQAEKEDKGAALVMLNELIGYYRTVSRHEDGARCAARALALIKELGLQKTVNHGTTLLNIATAFRVAGKYEQAEVYYKKVQEIFEKQLIEPDYRLASLYNNMGLLYVQTGRLEQAQNHLLRALQLTEQLPEMESERAITFTNLGDVELISYENVGSTLVTVMVKGDVAAVRSAVEAGAAAAAAIGKLTAKNVMPRPISAVGQIVSVHDIDA